MLPTLAGLVALALIVVFWLPGRFDGEVATSPANDIADGASQQQSTASPSRPESATEEASPWSDAQLAKLRKEAQDVLAILLDVQFELQEMGVSHFRLVPHSQDIVAVAEVFHNVLEGGLAADEAGERLRELVDCGALGYGPNKRKELEETLVPLFSRIGEALKQPGMVDMDLGQAVAQSTLMAFEQGLGTCCQGSADWSVVEKAFGLPEGARIVVAQTVGYPVESADAGGQRPRQPFEKLFQLNSYDTPFPRSEAVVAELTGDGLFQEPAPKPGREEEIEALREKYDLPGSGMI